MKRAVFRALALGTAAVAVSLSAPPATADAGPWRTVQMPYFWPSHAFNDVAPASANRVWMAGVQGVYCIQWMPMTPCVTSSQGNPVVRLWNGSGWQEYPIDGFKGQGHMSSVETGGGETWVTGHGHEGGNYVGRFTGGRFVPAPTPNGEQVRHFRGNSDAMWATTWSSDRHALHRWNGSGWTTTPTPTSLRWVNDVRFRTPTDGWAVGQTEPDPNTYGSVDVPALAHWNGTSWTSVPPHTASGHGERLMSVAPVAADDVWATTLDSVLHWNGTTWTTIPSPDTDVYRRTVTARGNGEVWLHLDKLTGPDELHRRDGSTWTKITIPSNPNVRSLFPVPGTDLLWAIATDAENRPQLLTNTQP